MLLGHIPAKALLFMAVVFLALVLAQLRWNADVPEQAPPEAEGPQVDRIQISQGGRLVDVKTEPITVRTSLDDLMESSIGSLRGGSSNERRTAAVELSYMANTPSEQEKLLALGAGLRARLRQALLDGLRDPDSAVARPCSGARIGWWRTSASPAVTQYLQSGLSALSEGQLDAALETFQSIEGLGRPCPPDVYRMKAEVYLDKSLPEQALAEARRALQAEQRHFAALYIMARAYAQLGQDRKALEALDEALTIYPGYAEAQHLRAQLYRAA